MLHRIHLTGKGMSQRAVRYKVLTMPEVDKITQAADKMITAETKVSEYNNMVEKMCLETMVQQVSEPCKADDLPTAKWTVVSPDDMVLRWKDYFNVKDTAVLKSIHASEHMVSKADIDAILEKKLDEIED